MNLAQLVLKNTGVQVLAKVVVSSLRILASVLLARYLLVEGFGEYSILFVIMGIAEAFVDFGASHVSAGELTKDWEGRNRFVSNLMAIKVVLAGAALAVTVALANFMGYSDELRRALYIATPVYFFFVLTSSGLVLFETKLKMEYAALANSVDAIVYFACVLGVIHWGGNLVHLVLAVMVSKAVNMIITYYLVRQWVTPSLREWSLSDLAALFRKILPLGISLLMVILYHSVDIIMLSKMSGTEAVGIYGAAYRFVYILPTLSAMLLASVFPLLVRYRRDDRDQFRLIFQKCFDYTAIVAVFTFLVLLFASEAIIFILFGEAFLRSVPVLQILGGGVALMLFSSLMGPCFIVVDKQDKAMILAILGVVINVTLNLIMIPRLSYIGAAAATVITELSLLVPGTYLLMRYFGFELSLSVTGKAVMAGLLCAVFLRIANSDDSLVLLLVGMVCYFAILVLTGAIPKADVLVLRSKA